MKLAMFVLFTGSGWVTGIYNREICSKPCLFCSRDLGGSLEYTIEKYIVSHVCSVRGILVGLEYTAEKYIVSHVCSVHGILVGHWNKLQRNI